MEEARQLWKNVEHLLLVQKHWQINLESWDLALFKYNFRSAVKRPASSLIYNYFRSHILLSLTKPAATSTFIWPQTQLAFDQLHFSFKQGHQNFNFHKNSQSKELSDWWLNWLQLLDPEKWHKFRELYKSLQITSGRAWHF